MKKIISIDIGSTYTKGALFVLEDGALTLLRQKAVTTTIDMLKNGFDKVLKSLQYENDAEIFFSSSAKGGLKTAAIGIVPGLTLESAKQAALSAGARITGVYSYKLCDEDIEKMRKEKPDIILFTGGTDGGSESYNIHNAKILEDAKLDVSIVYAGNRSISKKISEMLSSYDLHIASNVLPELDRLSPEDAREKIREVFLDKIICGKGLDKIVEKLGVKPFPTPYSMFEFLKKIYKHRPSFGGFCVIDPGGATTDFYSCCPSEIKEAGTVIKGLPEPEIKRTVEGDLGMRVSAAATFESMKDFIVERLVSVNKTSKEFESYIGKVVNDYGYLPETDDEKIFEKILAQACCMGALKRHAGTVEEAYLPEGKFLIQRGKNLRGVNKIIFTGGYLSRMEDGIDFGSVSDRMSLVPEKPEYYRDINYIFPLLANISFKYSEEAISMVTNSLQKTS